MPVLPPDARVVLTEALRPDAGWQLDHAVATTFTLDLATALLVPLAFAAHQLRDGADDPLAILGSVRGCADRVDIFCQAGNIQVPKSPSELLSSLEGMIHQVRRPRAGRLFHPKLWLVRYVNEDGEPAHRLLVLSRNLTADRAWDTCLRLDGRIGRRVRQENQPLADLLRWLLDDHCVTAVPDDRNKRVAVLADQVRRVEWTLPEHIDELNFHVLGIGKRPRYDFNGTRHLVVSPFLNEGGLDRVVPTGGTATIITRQQALNELPPARVDRYTPYVINSLAGVGEDPAELKVGLHTKLYLIEYDRRAWLRLGSANATDAAFGGNVEIMVDLVGPKSKIGIDALLKEPGFAGMLEPAGWQADGETDDESWSLENLLRALAEVPLIATVRPSGNDYAIDLTSEAPLPAADDVTMSVGLITSRGVVRPLVGGDVVDVRFDGLGMTEITAFVTLTVTDGSGAQRGTIVYASLVGAPDERLDEILARHVDSPEKFLRFVALLLGLLGGLEPNAVTATAFGSGRWVSGSSSGLFEMLVRAVVDQPAALDDLARLIERLRRTESGRRVLPPGFTDLWSNVQAARATLSARATT
jgi:hypothetical protein